MRGSRRPHVIGIAGPSGSGKTSLARLVAERVPGGGVVIALDAYYRDQSGIPEHEINVDEPDALDHTLVVAQVGALARGEPVQQPLYDYATHARLAGTRRVEPAPFVIVDGLFVLYWDDVRRHIHTPVFLSLDHRACLARRIARDVVERGRSEETVRSMYERNVRPMYDRYVHPTRQHARLILDATEPLDTLAGQLLAAIR